ncbi:MAG: DUF2330 domain-containing protein [Candidatus Sericytochromatia bacterium]|nr:DUF2330 domain-containing protein [Candidatus Tanganyikabacteria bacterium]
MRKSIGILGAAALAWSLAAPAALACGGFFCRNVPVDQAGEKIVFGVDHDNGDVFAIIQIQYAGKAEDFSWVIPLPATPSVGVSSDEVFRRLGPPTIPQFRLNYKTEGTCKTDGPMFAFGDAGGATRAAAPQAESAVDNAGVTVISREKVGPFDASVLLPSDPKALEEWLKKEGYRIPDSFGELSKTYIQQKFYFVALKLLKDKETGDLQPVVVKFKEKYPCVPVRLTAIAAQENMPIIMWVFARSRAIPKNYYHVALNEALIDWVGASPRWAMGAPIRGGGTGQPAPNYDAVVTQSMAEAGGNGFVTELATSSSVVKASLTHNYDPDKLKGLTDPAAFMREVANQAYPRGGVMQNLMRKYLPLPADLATRGTDEMTWWNSLFFGSNQFRTTPADFAAFDAAKFAEDIRTTFVKPIDEAADLIGRLPYLTRMYTTMTVAAMGAKDPLFAFNSKLGDVSNVHTADAAILCNPDVYEHEAPYRITLANGHSFVIEPDKQDRRYKPLPLGSMPAAFRIEQLAEEAPSELIADNGPKIDEVLKKLPIPKSVSAGPGCACNGLPNMKLGADRPRDTSAADTEAVFWGVALGALFAWRWRRRNDKA